MMQKALLFILIILSISAQAQSPKNMKKLRKDYGIRGIKLGTPKECFNDLILDEPYGQMGCSRRYIKENENLNFWSAKAIKVHYWFHNDSLVNITLFFKKLEFFNFLRDLESRYGEGLNVEQHTEWYSDKNRNDFWISANWRSRTFEFQLWWNEADCITEKK